MATDLQELERLTATLLEPNMGKIIDLSINGGSIKGTYLWKEEKVAVQLMEIQNGMSLPINFRNELEVLVVFIGSLQVEMDGEEILYQRGDVVIIHSGKGHICKAVTDVSLIAISIPASEEYPNK